jgi:hypothetical protein
MNPPRLLYLPWQLLIFGSEALRKSFYVKKKFSEPSLLKPGFARPGTDTDNKDSQSECTEEQEKCARRRRIRNQRPKRRKDKLIRLDDLIPKQDVTGGHQLPFGVPDRTQSTNNPTKDK